MATTVEITMDDSGKIMVGLTDSPSSDPSQMQPADNLAGALAMAKHLLGAPEDDGKKSGDMQSGAGMSGAMGGDASASASDPNAPPMSGGSAGQANSPADAKKMWDQMAGGNGQVPPN